jgi:hypothetical protein
MIFSDNTPNMDTVPHQGVSMRFSARSHTEAHILSLEKLQSYPNHVSWTNAPIDESVDNANDSGYGDPPSSVLDSIEFDGDHEEVMDVAANLLPPNLEKASFLTNPRNGHRARVRSGFQPIPRKKTFVTFTVFADR